MEFGNKAERQAIKFLEIEHSGVCGPMRNMFARCFVTFIDDFSRKVLVYMIYSKDGWFERFKEFRSFVKTQLRHEIKAFRWRSI